MKSKTKKRIYGLMIAVCIITQFLIACAYDQGMIRFWPAACSIVGMTFGWLFFFTLIRLEETRAARSPRRW